MSSGSVLEQPWILGVGYSHNGAACLLRGDDIHVMVQEERLTGVKRARIQHHQDSLAVRYCLSHAGLSIEDVDMLAVCHFSGPSAPPVDQPDRSAPLPKRYGTLTHHLGHAYAVLATSGFDDAAVLVIDGQGGTAAHLPPEERINLRRGGVPGQVRETEVASIYRVAGDGLTLVEKHTGEFLPTWSPDAPPAPARDRCTPSAAWAASTRRWRTSCSTTRSRPAR